MPLKLPTEKFTTWKDIPAGYLYPGNCDDNNHIHVVGSKWSGEIEINSVSIKINGKNTNLAVGSAITGFKFKPHTAVFPDGDLGVEYMNALRNAGVIA